MRRHKKNLFSNQQHRKIRPIIAAALNNVTTELQWKFSTLLHEFSLQDIQFLQTILGQAKAIRDSNNTKTITSKNQPTDFPPRQSPLLQTHITSKGLIVACPTVAEHPTYTLLQHHKTTSSLNMTPPTQRVAPSTRVILPPSYPPVTSPPTAQRTPPNPRVVPPPAVTKIGSQANKGRNDTGQRRGG